jgi:uncharacterized membrane protein
MSFEINILRCDGYFTVHFYLRVLLNSAYKLLYTQIKVFLVLYISVLTFVGVAFFGVAVCLVIIFVGIACTRRSVAINVYCNSFFNVKFRRDRKRKESSQCLLREEIMLSGSTSLGKVAEK